MSHDYDDTDAMLNEMMARGREVQSSAFRSRDAQIRAIANDWIDTGMGRDIAYEWASEVVHEAEARGAAEQRRKDAEGQEPVGYVSHGGLEYLASGKGMRVQNLYGYPDNTWPVPLYTRPANVAALEARVKELEGERDALKKQIQAMNPGSARPVIHSPTRFMDDSRAALTREGGV
ncbi:hypothetical protein [Gluconobacter roseus]|uniref:hypothetical protein n=1 Tax=Gluconobacter roseus TaxID=586239 RepID=UPI0038D24836